ncbi:MAG: DUF4296 domain-containing protein [Muribaculaceae bacterium]|nr:DUF4296 domain-containing protein [Muribaculaceae bacterium]MDE6320952.1 DUF4296 domain-containing protein [Muribaculaceae bacterium]
MMRQLYTLVIATFLLIIAACDSTPDKVLPKDKMADVMADMYVAESVADVNRTKFYTGGSDSLRKVLKQSILQRHGITQEDLDSSLMYYGRNLDKYVEVHDLIVEKLEQRMSQADAAMARAAGSMAGDSVDTWPGAPEVIISQRSPQQMLTFVLTPDDNWEKGDQYVWSIKTLNMRLPGHWTLAVDYPEGITEYAHAQFQGEGLNQLRLITDSTRIPTRIYGSLTTNPAQGEIIYLDSISLTRKRVDRQNYHQRHRQQRISMARQNKNTPKSEDTAPLEEESAKKEENDNAPVQSAVEVKVTDYDSRRSRITTNNAAALAN